MVDVSIQELGILSALKRKMFMQSLKFIEVRSVAKDMHDHIVWFGVSCTHYPVLQRTFSRNAGQNGTQVSSADWKSLMDEATVGCMQHSWVTSLFYHS